jgi:predicted transposase YdaD
VVTDANIEAFQEANMLGKKAEQCLKDLGYIDKWRKEGREEGEAEGEAKGKAEGEAKMIIRILSRRLKTPPQRLQKKISSIRDIAKLDELADFALTCVSLDEFATALK